MLYGVQWFPIMTDTNRHREMMGFITCQCLALHSADKTFYVSLICGLWCLCVEMCKPLSSTGLFSHIALHKKVLYAGGEDGTLCQLVVKGNHVLMNASQSIGSPIICLSFSPSHHKLAVSCSVVSLSSWNTFTDGSSVRVWSPRGECRARTYDGGLGEEPQQDLGVRAKPPEAERFFAFAQMWGVDQFVLKAVWCRAKKFIGHLGRLWPPGCTSEHIQQLLICCKSAVNASHCSQTTWPDDSECLWLGSNHWLGEK